ncbi:MAG: hypothetical protein R2770_15350 [Acidimicrobiales bacterium]|nr:hypothetical protein [Acidimicrobiales bacterium]
MDTRTLTSAKGFLIVDLPDAESSVGPARLGDKLIPSNAIDYVREITYGFGIVESKWGGATLGLKVSPEEREATVGAVAGELADELGAHKLMFDQGLRMPRATLNELAANDPRPVDRAKIGDDLEAAGIVQVAAALLGDLSGKAIAIDGVDSVTALAAAGLATAGARIARVSDGKTAVSGDIPPSALADRLAGDEQAIASHGDAKPAWTIWKGEGVDLVIAGSKVGAMTDQGAAVLGDTPVVCYGVSPVVTKAIATSRRSGGRIVPAFVTSLGRRLLDTATSQADAAQLHSAAQQRLSSVLEATLESPAGPYVAACELAEAFISSWTDKPFGRPMA